MNMYLKIVVLLVLPFFVFGQKFRQEIQNYNSVTNLRNETFTPRKNDKVYIHNTKHIYAFDNGNTTSTDDGLNYIIQTAGAHRWVCLNCHLRTELSQDSILLQYDANNILVSRDTIRLSGGEERICLNTANPPFVVTTPGQNEVTIEINRVSDPVDITSFKIDGEELLTGAVALYDAGGDYVYTNELVPIFNTYMAANGYTGVIDDDYDNNEYITFYALSGMPTPLSFEFVTNEGGNIITYVETSSPNSTSSIGSPNNPTTQEIESYVTANNIDTNGTQLVYFVEGDGGSCDNPDYIWTVNGDDITLSNKRVFNTKTVYVDAGSGSDVTGRRGYREFPFKTLNAAIAVTQTGDLLKVFPGDYTQTTTIQNLINIDCDNGVNWDINLSTEFFNTTPDWALDVTTTWNFDKLRNIAPFPFIKVQIKNSLGTFVFNANTVEFISMLGDIPVKRRSINIKNNLRSFLLLASSADGVNNLNIDYCERRLFGLATNNLGNPGFIGAEMGDRSKLTFHIKNLSSTNSNSTLLVPAMGYFSPLDTGIDKQYTTIVDNATHSQNQIYTTPPGPLAPRTSWSNVLASNRLFVINWPKQGSTYTLDIKNIKSTGHGVQLSGTDGNESTIIVNIKGVFEKGIPVFLSNFNTAVNTKVIINLDVECHTSMGVFIGFEDGANNMNNILASNQIVVTGRIKTRYAGMSCISIGQGSAPSNNTNGTILLKDLTLINDGLVSPIMCAVPENVQIQNVTSNSLISDPNITEVGQSIIRNTNYK